MKGLFQHGTLTQVCTRHRTLRQKFSHCRINIGQCQIFEVNIRHSHLLSWALHLMLLRPYHGLFLLCDVKGALIIYGRGAVLPRGESKDFNVRKLRRGKISVQTFWGVGQNFSAQDMRPGGKHVVCDFGGEERVWNAHDFRISWLCNVSGPMVRHNCHGISISTHPAPVKSSFSL